MQESYAASIIQFSVIFSQHSIKQHVDGKELRILIAHWTHHQQQQELG